MIIHSRPGSAPLGILASVVGVSGAAIFALAEGAAAAVPAGESLLIGAAVAGTGYVFLKLGGWIVETRDLARETHAGLFHPDTGVFQELRKREAREAHQDERLARHSGELRAIREEE